MWCGGTDGTAVAAIFLSGGTTRDGDLRWP
jgi:hypothetical protein